LRLLWELPDGKAQLPVGVPVAIIELRGDCNSRPPNTRANGEAKNLPLGWTLVEEGEVMPYSVVDCDRISGTFAAWFNRAAESPARVGMYWRLMGRVAAHELMHALLRTTEHGRTDATRARVRSGDLLFGARLEPEEVAALRRLGQSRMRVAERSNRNTSPSAPVSSP
ncbi:MAG: hypothetical protein HY236_07260, partial [Acidobacteria bacterium]|nr:hypothetical protein [Acidobacteriota bacterium]